MLGLSSGRGGRDLDFENARRLELVEGQYPFAIVLGCSDSRVPLELIFDQGLGDLFVVRVAGNIVAPSQAGSIEFAAQRFGTPLVVIMGHSGCGAVEATIDEVLKPTALLSPNLEQVVSRIRPAVNSLLEEDPEISRESLSDRAVRTNVAMMTARLTWESALLKDRVAAGRLVVVGAEYALETGARGFFRLSPRQGNFTPRWYDASAVNGEI